MLEGITDCYQVFSWDPHQLKNVSTALILQFNFLNPWVDVPVTLLHLEHMGYVGDYNQNSFVIL